jgi:hypothetical protein
MTAKSKILLCIPIGFLLIATAVAIAIGVAYRLILHGVSSIPLLWPILAGVFLLLVVGLRFIMAANRARNR